MSFSEVEQSVLTDDFKFAKQIGEEKLSFQTIQSIVKNTLVGNVWIAYQNHDLSNSTFGNIVVVRVGPNSMNKKAPRRCPDGAQWGLGWRYVPIGFVDPITGDIHSS